MNRVYQMNPDKFLKTVIVGGGLLGTELLTNLSNKGVNVQKLSCIEYDNFTIPENTECIIFVAQSKDYKSETMTNDLLFVNSIMPSQVLIEAYRKGVKRIAFCSTGSVYSSSTEPHKEDEIILPSTSFYEASKKASELLLFPWKKYFERLIIFRPFFIYGPQQTEEKLLYRIISNVKNNSTIKLGQNKGLVFNPIHVYDASEFISQTIFDKEGFDIFNLAGNEITNLKEITDLISNILNKVPNIEITDNSVATVLGSTDKMKLENFSYRYNLQTGLEDTISSS